jgi:tyrosyl-tRNA synthetase
LRDIGKHFSVNQMLSRESVSARLEAGGISYTEFSYQVLQAFDFLELSRRNNCLLQIGGSDQWGNIVAGVDLIRRVASKSAHALTIPLLAKADGTKFGKTAGGSIWLDPTMTTPYAFFQFFLNSDDRDVEQLLRTFSFKSHDELEALFDSLKTNPGAREAHRALAREVTSLIHGESTTAKVENAAKALFGQAEIRELDVETLESALSELPRTTIRKGEPIPTWVDLIAASGAAKREARSRFSRASLIKQREKAFFLARPDLPPLKISVILRFSLRNRTSTPGRVAEQELPQEAKNPYFSRFFERSCAPKKGPARAI